MLLSSSHIIISLAFLKGNPLTQCGIKLRPCFIISSVLDKTYPFCYNPSNIAVSFGYQFLGIVSQVLLFAAVMAFLIFRPQGFFGEILD